MRTNMHTHSVYCDGMDTPEEMIHSALEGGFDILGFSGHGYSPFDTASMSPKGTLEYQKTIRMLEKKYQDQITIYLGIEQDSTCRIPSRDPYDFVIASVHFLEKDGAFRAVDYSRQEFDSVLAEWYDGNILQMAEDYYRRVGDQADFAEADILGHIDLFTKYNEDESYIRFNDPEYLRIACDCLDRIGDRLIYEVNTGAIARGYRTLPYPDANLLACMKERNLRIMLNSDCHDRRKLDCGYELSLDLIKKAGFQELWILKNGQFQPVELSQFH